MCELMFCWVEVEDVQMVKHVLGRWLDDVSRHWVNFPTYGILKSI